MLPLALQKLSFSAGWMALNKFELPLLKHLPSCQTAGLWKEAGQHLKPVFLSFTPSRSRAASWEPGRVPRKSIPGFPSSLLQLLHRWEGGSCSLLWPCQLGLILLVLSFSPVKGLLFLQQAVFQHAATLFILQRKLRLVAGFGREEKKAWEHTDTPSDCLFWE